MQERTDDTDAEPVRLYRALVALLQHAQRDPRLRAELAQAHREFFGPEAQARGAAPGADSDQAIATTRFAEWYLLERESAVLGSVPLAVLGEVAAPGAVDALADSLAGLFLAESGTGPDLRVRDLQSGRTLELETYGLLALGPADLLIGRLYHAAHGRWVPSAAIAVQRDGVRLARAFVSDLQKLQLERRLSQAELEQLWFQRRPAETPEPAPPIERLEAELETLLGAVPRTAGLTAAGVSAALQQAPRPGPVVGPLLEQLAFETTVDLERALRLLVSIWNHHHAQAPPAAAPGAPPAAAGAAGRPGFAPRPGETLGQSLARRIREGLENHEDVEELFADVEQMLGEPDEDDADGGEDDGVEPVAGNLDALVQEYLWETQPQDAGVRAALQRFVAVQREAPKPKDEIEYLEPGDVLRWLLEVYLHSTPGERAAAATGAFAALRAFYAWVEATQGYEIAPALAAVHERFVRELPRLQAASLALSTAAPAPAARPSLLRVQALLPDGAEVVPVDYDQPAVVALGGADLHVGDLIVGGLERRGQTGGRFVGTVVVLPATAEPLLG
jgi:hypothetical protein